MELSWSTFVLEVINFLVLVWILQRFFYRPVTGVIARRRAAIEQSMKEAETLRAEADRLRQQYEGRLAEWDRERQEARAALEREIEAERARKLAELRDALEQEREKARVAEERRRRDLQRGMEQAALQLGARFATRLLEQAAGPEVQGRLVEMALAELDALAPGRLEALRQGLGTAPDAAIVASAFPLPEGQRQRLRQALATLVPGARQVRFERDPGLLAGVRVTIGSWVLDANLRQELSGFVALARDE